MFPRVLPLLLLVLFAAACSGSSRSSADKPGIVVATLTPSTPSGGPPTATSATPAASSASTPVPVTPGSVTLNAVGDLMLARDIIDLMDANGSVYPFAAVRALLADADVTIANMEGTFTERGARADKFYTFRTPPRHARGLAEAGIDVVALGNNHAMDFGSVGLSDTMSALDVAGVLHSGAGPNEQAARRPALLTSNGLRLAFLSYNGVSEATFATASGPGVAAASVAAVRQDVAAALQSADLVIVSLHAGTEYVDAPNETQRSVARAAIDAGAALVLGSHAHVFQGWESYSRGVIVWGLGNFVFDLDYDDMATLGPRPFQTAVLRFELTREGVRRVEARPVFIDPGENRPRPATGEQAAAIEARIERLNAAYR